MMKISNLKRYGFVVAGLIGLLFAAYIGYRVGIHVDQKYAKSAITELAILPIDMQVGFLKNYGPGKVTRDKEDLASKRLLLTYILNLKLLAPDIKRLNYSDVSALCAAGALLNSNHFDVGLDGRVDKGLENGAKRYLNGISRELEKRYKSFGSNNLTKKELEQMRSHFSNYLNKRKVIPMSRKAQLCGA